METQDKADATALYELERQRSVIRDRVRDVAARRHTSAYVFGPAGTGKTRIVRDALDQLGEAYHYHSGHLTALGYFDLLRDRPDDVIVLDDVSSLFRDRIGQQLLLASLGSACGGSGWTRVVRYQRRGRSEVVNLSGGVIALSNLRLRDDDEVMVAIKSRTKPLCWDPTEAQLAAVMRDAVAEGWERDGVTLTAEECGEVIDFVLDRCRHFNVTLDLRLLFDAALPDRAASKAGEHEADWRDHTQMAVREQVRRLQFTGAPKTRSERLAMEAKIAERIRAAHNTRREQVEAWWQETGKSERAFDRRSAGLRLAD